MADDVGPQSFDAHAREQLDRVAIQELVQRERVARDMHQWSELAASYHDDSLVDISWFKGTGADFAQASADMAARGLRSFHQMGPTTTRILGDRALADTGTVIHLVTALDGVEVDAMSHARLYMRAERRGAVWLLSGFRSAYVQDMIVPLNPSLRPTIDPSAVAQYRASYRYISYVLAQRGHAPNPDLPGTDRPDTIEALLTGERAWLAQAA